MCSLLLFKLSLRYITDNDVREKILRWEFLALFIFFRCNNFSNLSIFSDKFSVFYLNIVWCFYLLVLMFYLHTTPQAM